MGGNLHLSATPIEKLPDNLTVGGSLYLSGTPIKTLPEGGEASRIQELKTVLNSFCKRLNKEATSSCTFIELVQNKYRY